MPMIMIRYMSISVVAKRLYLVQKEYSGFDLDIKNPEIYISG